MVFSKLKPQISKPSIDRWLILQIVNNELIGIKNNYSNSQNVKYNVNKKLDKKFKKRTTLSSGDDSDSSPHESNDFVPAYLHMKCENCNEKFSSYNSLHKHTLEKHENS